MGQFYAFMTLLTFIFVAGALSFVAMFRYKPTPRQMRPWMMGFLVISVVAMCLVLRLPVAITVFFVVLMVIASIAGTEVGQQIDVIVELRKLGVSDSQQETAQTADSELENGRDAAKKDGE